MSTAAAPTRRPRALRGAAGPAMTWRRCSPWRSRCSTSAGTTGPACATCPGGRDRPVRDRPPRRREGRAAAAGRGRGADRAVRVLDRARALDGPAIERLEVPGPGSVGVLGPVVVRDAAAAGAGQHRGRAGCAGAGGGFDRFVADAISEAGRDGDIRPDATRWSPPVAVRADNSIVEGQARPARGRAPAGRHGLRDGVRRAAGAATTRLVELAGRAGRLCHGVSWEVVPSHPIGRNSSMCWCSHEPRRFERWSEDEARAAGAEGCPAPAAGGDQGHRGTRRRRSATWPTRCCCVRTA